MIGSFVLEKMMCNLTERYDDGRQPLAIRHLCDKGDLRIIRDNLKLNYMCGVTKNLTSTALPHLEISKPASDTI